jgi:hypothetical protein
MNLLNHWRNMMATKKSKKAVVEDMPEDAGPAEEEETPPMMMDDEEPEYRVTVPVPAKTVEPPAAGYRKMSGMPVEPVGKLREQHLRREAAKKK